MGKKLAIKGHSTRGKEVIKILAMLGGKHSDISGSIDNKIYYIDDNRFFSWDFIGNEEIDKYKIFTLEEFLEKYPFYNGDKVFDIVDGDPGIITAMKWDEDISDMKYHVAFYNGDMGWYTNDTIGFLKEKENLEEGKTMNKKLAIKGHPTRGKEIFELMEMMGGNINKKILSAAIIGDVLNPRVYFFDPDSSDNRIVWNYLLSIEHDGRASEMMIFTLEEFLEKYPFKVGDKVFLYDNITEGCVTGMEWDEDKGTVKYCVYTSSECWCDVEELLKWNNADLNERDYKKQCEEMNEIQTKRDMDKTMFMLTHILLPETPHNVNDKLEYKIIDGYKFDRVENDKIILKVVKPKYPTTYDECCDMLNSDEFVGYELMTNFPKLINARNAYWKIAGEEMGLGKPWEPNWTTFEGMPAIFRFRYNIVCDSVKNQHCLLVFPTEKMRDAFYENFKDLIEQCKELL